MSDETQEEDAMAEVVALDSPARSLYEMTPEREAHEERIVSRHAARMRTKYRDGQKANGGDLATKPGMLAHAIQENVDESFYLGTMEDQVTDLADALEAGTITTHDAATALRRLLTP